VDEVGSRLLTVIVLDRRKPDQLSSSMHIMHSGCCRLHDHHVTSHSNAFRFHRFTSKQLVLLMTYSICRKSIQTSVNQSQLLSLNILDSLNSTRGSLKQRSTIVGAAISVLLQTTSHQRHPAFDCWPAAAAEVGDSYCLVHRCHWAAPCRSDEHSMSLKRGGLKVTASIVSRLITSAYEPE